MKLRSGRAFGTKDVECKTLREVDVKLDNLHKLGESLMCDPNNFKKVSKLLQEVNSVYDACNDFSFHGSNADSPSSSFKPDFDTKYWLFKQKVQHWFNTLESSAKVSGSHDGHGPTTSELCEIGEGHSSRKVSTHSHVVAVSNCAKDLTTSKVGLQLEVPGVSKALESDVTFMSNPHGASREGQTGTLS